MNESMPIDDRVIASSARIKGVFDKSKLSYAAARDTTRHARLHMELVIVQTWRGPSLQLAMYSKAGTITLCIPTSFRLRRQHQATESTLWNNASCPAKTATPQHMRQFHRFRVNPRCRAIPSIVCRELAVASPPNNALPPSLLPIVVG